MSSGEAAANADWNAPLDADERDRLIDRVAKGIVGRRMETPAILFLEMHKPIGFLASQGVIVFSPFLAPFIGHKNLQLANRVMAETANVERLICRIEDLAAERQVSSRGKTVF